MHKETAKWLLAFVPIPTFVVLALSLGPRYEAISELGLSNWLDENPFPAIAFLLGAIAIVALTAMCCFVVLTRATDLAKLLADENWLAAAFSEHGAGEPVFLDAAAFKMVGSASKTGDDTVPEREETAYAKTLERLKQLSEDQKTRARFVGFVWVFIICAIVIFGALTVVAATLPNAPEAIIKPAKVNIYVSPGTEPSLTAATECTDMSKTTVVAVGGTWIHPIIRLFGTGCIREPWTPSPDLNAVITPA